MTVSAGVLGVLFLTGLLGGVHCMGMCGGIVAAVSDADGGRRVSLQLGYNLGRITSYAAAGALAGAAGSAGLLLDGVLPVQLALYVAANLMLIALGLYLAGAGRVVAPIEQAGLTLWRQIEPLARRLLPADTLPRAVGLGLLWGWIPCGLVYGILMTAVFSGNALTGAAVMAAFGAGTLPNLLLAGVAWRKLRGLRQARAIRLASGALVLGFGIYGLARAASLGEHIREGVLCLG